MIVDDKAARALLVRSWSTLLPKRDRTLAASQSIQAVARHESRYGMSWPPGPMGSSFNVGAIQCHAQPDANGKCPPGCSPFGDSHSNGQKYGACFRVYPTIEAGFLDFVSWFASKPDVLDAADGNNLYEFCLAMRRHKYFEARGSTDEERAMYYAKPVAQCALDISMALNEPLCVSVVIPDDAP